MKTTALSVWSGVARRYGRVACVLFAIAIVLVTSGDAPAVTALTAAAGQARTMSEPPSASSAPSAAPRQAPPDTTFRDCPHCPEMVRVPAGSFLMGSPESEAGRGADEGPQREITVESFAIGVYEVTFEEWDACVDDGGCGGYRPPDWGWGRGRRPVTEVSWQDARAYVEWLTRETGQAYGLPSEARWEYAARAGTRTARYWGESAEEQCRYANAFDRDLARTNEKGLAMFEEHGMTYPSCSDGQGDGTAPVGSYEPNAFGLHDMIGNVTEWTDDCWTPDLSGRPEHAGTRFSGDCSRRMLRGGTWAYPSEFLRSAYRFQFELDHRDNGLGFRVVRFDR